MKILVIGAGIMGLCAAWAAARAGHRVTVFEQGTVPNPLASSVDRHRLIRHPYGGDDGYCRMVDAAYAAWDELWSDIGERLYAETGTLVLSAGANEDWAERSLGGLARAGHLWEALDGDDIARDYPFLEPGGIAWGYRLERGGALFAARIVAALAARIQALGAEVRARTSVSAVDPTRARVTLESGDVVDADVLVVAAGAWSARLLPELGARLTPSRQVVAYLEPPPRYREAWAAAPMILDIDGASGFYAVPAVGGDAMKVGDHRFQGRGDPDDPREASADERDAILALCRRRLRDFDDYRGRRPVVCYYTLAPEERFVFEALGRAWVLAGFSGHGFKFGPLIGKALVAALDGTRGAAEVSAWAAGREV